MPNADTRASTIDVAPLAPTAPSPKKMNTPSATAQMKAMTPWSMLGGRGGWIIAAILDERVEGATQVRPWTKISHRAGRDFVHGTG